MLKKYTIDLENNIENILNILDELAKTEHIKLKDYQKILRKYPDKNKKIFSKHHLIEGYKYLQTHFPDKLSKDPTLLSKIQMKPVRTQSGVATITVLTKPFPCPGKCIFCPNDVRMPKSYIHNEPGAQRAARNKFDPYLQTYRRLQALEAIGHNVTKTELIILGGTWSFYPEDYQIWFIKRCFEALNDFGVKDETYNVENLLKDWNYLQKITKTEETKIYHNTNKSKDSYNTEIQKIYQKSNPKIIEKLETATWEELYYQHTKNQTAMVRCVGLVVETRPDKIDEEEVIRIRKLGCTKTQIGVQSLQDSVLQMNHRGHDVQATRRAFGLLRQAGFKIHAHWMANLYGSSPEKDIEEYKLLFEDESFCPDELKIYPCSLIETAELMDYHKAGKWTPYTHDELMDVVTNSLANTPEYCRLTRVIRDIPSTDIVTGNKITNFRQLAQIEAEKRGYKLKDIRAREIKNLFLKAEDLNLDIVKYKTDVSTEYFLQYITKDRKIAGFLRLSLPTLVDNKHPFISELDNSALIREIHVYGKLIEIGKSQEGRAQHLGLGTKLIQKAKEIASKHKFSKIAVISSIGTREYYKKRGFEQGVLYQSAKLS